MTSTDTATYADTSRPGTLNWRLYGIVIAIILSAALGAWAMARFGEAATDSLDPVVAAASGAAPTAAPVVPLAQYPAVTPVEAASFAERMAALEIRLSRLTAAIDTAGANAMRAEGILVALATRRAIDRGEPLGVLEDQLNARFGPTQPVAVRTVIATARDPMAADALAQQLADLRNRALAAPDAGVMDRIGDALGSIVVIRPASAPSPVPQQRFARAVTALQRGNLAQAIGEVQAMPGAAHPDVARWLLIARQRNDTSRALDLIEAAALSAPPATAIAPPAAAAPASAR